MTAHAILSLRSNRSALKQFVAACAQTVIFFAAMSGVAVAEYQLLDRVVAIVEDDIILQSELDQQMAMVAGNIKQRGKRLPPVDILYQQVLERQVLESLQLQRAKRIGMRISDQELNDAVIRVAASNNLSLTEFREAIEREGEAYLDVRERVRREMLIQEVQRRSVLRSISVSPSEIDNFLRSEQGQLLLRGEVNIEHLLLPLDASASEQDWQDARNTLNTLRKRAIENDSFAAIETAVEAASASLSSLGWRRLDQVPSLFAERVATMSIGDISDVVRSDSGLHLIRIAAKRGGVDGIVTETHVRHILISPNEIRTDEEAKVLIDSVAAELRAGKSFDALAKQYSEDPGSALIGGDLGWTTPGKLVGEFQQAMDATAVGDISQPFHSDFGWHILEVLERRDKDLSEERSRNLASNVIAEGKYDDELNNWLQDLRDNAFIEIK